MSFLSRLFPTKRQFETMMTPIPITWDWNTVDPGELYFVMTREEALSIPGVARAHHTIVSKAAQLELIADNGSGVDSTPQPPFMERTDLGEAPEMRMWCTFDDLYFWGRSLWVVERGAAGQVLGARWLPIERWQVDENAGTVQIDGVPADPRQYFLFNVPMWAGLLRMGRRTLVGARDIERSWVARMRSPVNTVDLHFNEDANLTQAEVDAWVNAWQKKHMAGAPAVGATPPGVTLTTHTNTLGPADLFLQARDSIRTDIGSHSGLDGGMVDSTGGAGSLTYETREGQRGEFYEFDFPFWYVCITSRLSLDDVVPRGTRTKVRFRPVVAPNQEEVDFEQVRYSIPAAPADPEADTSTEVPGG